MTWKIDLLRDKPKHSQDSNRLPETLHTSQLRVTESGCFLHFVQGWQNLPRFFPLRSSLPSSHPPVQHLTPQNCSSPQSECQVQDGYKVGLLVAKTPFWSICIKQALDVRISPKNFAIWSIFIHIYYIIYITSYILHHIYIYIYILQHFNHSNVTYESWVRIWHIWGQQTKWTCMDVI